MAKRVVIMGAAGRDFHNFNQVYRGNKEAEVVAFTAAQIPDIAGRKYPEVLAGSLYPDGIPIHDEKDLAALIKNEKIDEVVFAYSDISHENLMHKASLVLASGADFKLLGPKSTMLKSKKPVVSITATRTGCGKSPASRRVLQILREAGKKVVAIRHPMPYGDLAEQTWQRFETLEDLVKHKCTIEEMEEYEPHIEKGAVVYAGVDYGEILKRAEEEADVIIWDGGNNDFSFIAPDIDIVITDPHRPNHELRYYPGETNFLAAQVLVISKMDSADPKKLEVLENNIAKFNPTAKVIRANLTISVEDSAKILGKRVLVVEDGPTLTHGEMAYGAGVLAAKKFGAANIIDPKPFLVGEMVETFTKYPFIRDLLPAMGYGGQQVKDLEETINRTACDVVLIATPIDLRRVCNIKHDTVRASYDMEEIGKPDLNDVLKSVTR